MKLIMDVEKAWKGQQPFIIDHQKFNCHDSTTGVRVDKLSIVFAIFATSVCLSFLFLFFFYYCENNNKGSRISFFNRFRAVIGIRTLKGNFAIFMHSKMASRTSTTSVYSIAQTHLFCVDWSPAFFSA